MTFASTTTGSPFFFSSFLAPFFGGRGYLYITFSMVLIEAPFWNTIEETLLVALV